LEQILSKLEVQPLLLISGKGLIKRSNAGFSRVFFPVGEGDSLASYIHPEDRREFQTWFRNLNHESPELSLVKNFRLADKNGRVVSAMLRPERVSEQDFIFWFWEDKGINESEDYWQTALTPAMEAVFSSILDGVFLVNVEGKLIDVNQALCSMLGYHKFELIGMPAGKLFSNEADEIQKATFRFARIMKYGRVQEISLTLRDKAGAEVEVSLNGAVIRGEGNQLVGILGTVRDLREKKALRHLKEKTSELEKAVGELSERDKVKDDFLSMVGHELRTPLANILGYAEFLLEGGVNEEEKDKFLQVIYQESRRLARLVNEILDLSRMQAGRLVYHYVLQPMDPVIGEAVEAVAAEAEQKKIRVEKKINSGLTLWIDRDRIKQVAINLLNNAIKYSNPESEVRIETREMDQGALVLVEDHGIGIAREDQDQVFEKFGRVEELEHHTQGAGLGLTIVKLIIEDGHRGRVWLESAGVGKGSTFYFWLPTIAEK